MKRIILIAVAALVAVGSLLTKLPPTTGKPLLAGAQIDSAVSDVIRRSCGDCHSEATTYPWYSYIAPSSLLVASDVARGRRHLNLSQWEAYTPTQRMRKLSEMANQVKDGEMPLWWYTIIRRDARLSPADANAIFRWTQAERNRLIAQSGQSNSSVPGH